MAAKQVDHSTHCILNSTNSFIEYRNDHWLDSRQAVVIYGT